MGERNPYAPSQASLKTGTPSGAAGQVTAWRDERVLVMIPDTSIPHRCVKCNEPADEPTKDRMIYWYSSWLYLLLLLNVLIFAVVALIVRKKAVVAAGLCPEHKARRRNVIAGAWGGVLAGFLLIYPGATTSFADWSVPLGVLVMLSSIVVGIAMGRIVYPVRIDKDYVRLKGCGEAYLETLPDFPY